MVKAAVVGSGGYLGGELLRLLESHPRLELAEVVSKSQAGKRLGDVYPNLVRSAELRFRPDTAGIDADVAFLAQPPGEAMKEVPSLLERGVRAVDLGPDYRLPEAADYERVYKRPHADPDHLGEAVYGLPELFRERVARARLVANPGCYPTAALLAIAPLLERGLLKGPVVIDAKSGSSGAGHEPTPSTHHPEAALTVLPYGLPEHRHLAEMRAALGDESPPLLFVPHLIPVVRGILCSIYAPGSGASGTDAFERAYRERYEGADFVRLGRIPRLAWVQGTNRCLLAVERTGDYPIVFSALDNLGKGGAAQAIQNANLMLGLPEAEGLLQPGFAV